MAELVAGNVTDRPWGRTLAALGLRGVTGQLTVFSEGKRFLIAFQRGAVVAAASPLASDAAVRVALTGHLISSSQVPEISRRQAAAPERDEVGVIAELARLGPEHALRLRRRVIAQRAARTFSLNQGEFVVTDRTELAVVPGCELDIRAVIYMGVRTNMSEARLADELAQLGGWFRLKPSLDEDLPQYGFGDVEQPVLERLRDGGTVEQLEDFASSFVDGRTVRAVVYALAACSGCEIAGAERALESQKPATTTQPLHRVAPSPTPPPIPRTGTLPMNTMAQPEGAEPSRGPRSTPGPERRHTPSPSPPIAASGVAAGRPKTPSVYTSTEPMPTVATASTDGGSPAEESFDLRTPPDGSRPSRSSPPRRAGEESFEVRTPPDGSRPSRSSPSRRAGTDPAPRRPSDSSPAIRRPPDDARLASNPALRIPGETGSSPSVRRPRGVESSPQLVIRRITSRPPPTRRVARTDTAQSHGVKSLIAQRLKLLDQGADHFALLGVPQDVPSDALRKAYFGLARQLHPDRLAALGISDEGKHAQRLFAQINSAFAVLTDPTKRGKYLHVLQRGGEAAVRAEQARAEELARRILDAEEAFRRGELALRRDQPQVAVAELEIAVQLNPDEADYQALLSWSQFCAASDKQAIAAKTRTRLENAIQRAPKAVTARFYLGRVERMLGRDPEALRHFKDVLAAVPGHTDAAAEVRALEARMGGGDKSGGGLFGRHKR